MMLLIAFFMLSCGCMQKSPVKTQTTDESQIIHTSGSTNGVEYMIFGRYCGRCISDKCAPMYKIDFIKKLLLDNSSNYVRAQPFDFSKELTVEQFNMVSKVDTSMPDSLFLTSETRFGCPDCADQCGIYLEINKGGKKYAFELDNRISNMNGFIVNIATQLQEMIVKLSPEK